MMGNDDYILQELKEIRKETGAQTIMLTQMDGKINTINANLTGEINTVRKEIFSLDKQMDWNWRIWMTMIVGSGAVYGLSKFLKIL